MKKIFWLVGENSGDLHASYVIRRINQDILDCKHYGIGGFRMQAEGLTPLYPFERFAVMGFVEVIKHLLFFLRVQAKIRSVFEKDKPDIVILVDYPGLNMRIAKMADEFRIPVLYYICPQFWAWKHNRVYDLRANVRHVACILPFEKELLDIHNVTSTYVGHPIAEEIEVKLDRTSFAQFYGLDPHKKWIGCFPGSRNSEINRILPVFSDLSHKFNSDSYELLFSKAHSVDHQNYLAMFQTANSANRKLIDGYTYEMMKFCDLLVVTSGTATLEAAYIGTPLIIVYKTSSLSYRIGKYLVRVKRIGLPNIILDDDLLPEMVQDDVNPDNIYKTALSMMNDPERYKHIRNSLAHIRSLLGDRKASVNMLKIIKEMLKINV